MEKTEEKAIDSKEIQDARLVYEVSFLILPTLSEEEVAAQVASIKSAVEETEGVLISDENPVLIDLAYAMTKVVGTIRHKCMSGYFGWIKFDMPKGMIEGVKKALDANDTVLRYLIIKTVRENTLLNGKMNLKKEDKRGDTMPMDEVIVETEAEVVPVATEEVLDKSIDDLVIA